MKHFLFLSLCIGLVGLTAKVNAQTGIRPAEPTVATQPTEKTTTNDLLQLQESEVARLSGVVEQLRQLELEGLVAPVEVEKAEQNLAGAEKRVEETKKQIAASQQLAAERQKSAAEIVKTKQLVKPTLLTINRSASVTRATGGSWSMSQLDNIRQFFVQTFGRELPTTTIGQSATHNKLRWNHRNSVDVGIHPESAEGRALISYLQSLGIPFLAFRTAIRGVSTGPHIHIGNPSQRLG